jgi:mitochondrial chaperone BCS1
MENEEGQEAINMDGLQTMGIVNAMRTGDPRMDMLIAMLIPLIIRLLFDFAKRFENVFSAKFWADLYNQWINATQDECERVLLYSTRTKDENKNKLLSQAVLLYVNQVLKLELKNANITLMSPNEKEETNYDYNDYYNDDCNDNDQEEPETYADRLRKLEVLKMPFDDEWVDLGQFGEQPAPSSVMMLYHRDQVEGEKHVLVDAITTLRFRSKSRQAIDTFIDRAYDYYVEEIKKAETNHRHFYELKTAGDDDNGDNDEYTRYRLSDEKTFDSLFFPEKEALLRMLTHFLERSGKYAIKGYPHKLGLLLHGPPGTGK